MTKVHRQLLRHLKDVRAVSLNTPYGFQANVPQMTEKIVEYFSTSLNLAIESLDYQSFSRSTEVSREVFRQGIRAANYVFSGPGSPSYAVHQWTPIGIDQDLRSTLAGGGVVCFASAAALTLGAFTVPVYEIYKVGTEPFWLNGLDVLSMAGVRGAIIPHFDNAEGGNYDTRYCYLGEDRLVQLERQLADDVGVLGIDEHTAAILDLEADTLSVLGKGNAYWRRAGDTRTYESGSIVKLEEIRSFEPTAVASVAAQAPVATPIDELAASAAMGGDTSIEAIATLARLAKSGGKGFIDPTPLVEGLLQLRVEARAKRDFALADELRDAMVNAGIEVNDGPDGSTWSLK